MRAARIISAAVLVAGALMLMSGCGDVATPNATTDNRLSIYLDSARGVACYQVYEHSSPLSCVKVAP